MEFVYMETRSEWSRWSCVCPDKKKERLTLFYAIFWHIWFRLTGSLIVGLCWIGNVLDIVNMRV